MSIISTANIAKALWPGVNDFWGMSVGKYDAKHKQVFEVKNDDRDYVEDVQVVGFGLAEVKPQGGSVTYDTQQQGYVSRYTHVVYGKGYILTEEEISDNQYPRLVEDRTGNLAYVMSYTKDLIHANVLNRAFNASYTGGDGKVLCASDHPDGSGGTFSNLLTTAADLSETSLEDMFIQIMNNTDARGNKYPLEANSLVVPNAEFFNAHRILKSVLQNDTANNAVNVLKAVNALPGGIVNWTLLSNTSAWFVTTKGPNLKGLRSFDRWPLKFAQDSDFDTANIKYKATMRFSAGWTDPRGIWGTPGV